MDLTGLPASVLRAARQHVAPDALPPEAPQTSGRAPAGQGRRGHLRKTSVEFSPAEHDRLKTWVVTAFGGGTSTASVLRALLAEAYADPALIERVRRRLLKSLD